MPPLTPQFNLYILWDCIPFCKRGREQIKPNIFLPFDEAVSIELGVSFLQTFGGCACNVTFDSVAPEAEMLTAVVSGSKDLGDGKISGFTRFFRVFKFFLH